MINLGADPPLFYLGHGDDLLTDPFHITHFARNIILFDDGNPFDYHRWDIFKSSVVSLASFIMFAIFGVSRLVANLTAVLLSVGGGLLFLCGLSKEWGNRKLFIAALLLLINSTLFYYGRLPFLENGLIFFSGLLFFVFARFHDRLWGQILIGFLVAMAALAGKLFGFILIGPVLIALTFKYRQKVIIPAVAIVGGLISGIAVWVIVLYNGSWSGLTSYYGEQTVGMYGPPPGFSSPLGFVKMLLTYGGESGLWQYTPFLILLTLCSLLLIILFWPRIRKLDNEFIPLIFVVGWFLCGIFGLMPFQYRPLRYALFLYLPLSAICAYAINMVWDKSNIPERFPKLGFGTAPLFFLTLWYLLTQVWMVFAPSGSKFKFGVEAMPLAGAIAIGVTAILFFIFKSGKIKFHRRSLLILFAVICAGVLIVQSRSLYRGMANPNYDLTRYSSELKQALGEGAVLTGPFAATLTIDNDLKNIIYMFGLAIVERDLFEKFPITHIAADNGNWEVGQKDFPQLKATINMTQLYMRNKFIDINRLPNAKSPPTDFEQGSIWISKGRPDSAYYYYKKFTADYPNHRMAQKHLAYAALFKGSIDEALKIIDRLHKKNPDSYVTHEICKFFYNKAYAVTKNEIFKKLEEQHARIAQELKN